MKKIAVTIFLSIFLTSGLAFAPARQAQAFLGFSVVFDPISKAMQIIGHALAHLTNLSLGYPGQGAAHSAAISAARQVCDTPDQAFTTIMTAVDNLDTVSVLSGGVTEIGQLSAKITKMAGLRICYYSLMKGVDTYPGLSLQEITANAIQKAQIQTKINSLDERIQELTNLRKEIIKKLWESVAYRILMTAQQKLTTKMVNQMVQKYKISNFSNYADAVATQIYTTDYIAKNYPDASDQLLLRSIIQNEQTTSKVLPLVRQKANDALGFMPSELNASDPDYYAKLARAGTGDANPFFVQSMFEDRASLAKAQGQVLAQSEISQGQGFIPARNCSGVAAQENSRLDKERAALSNELRVRQAALSSLLSQEVTQPGSVPESEVAKAKQDIAKMSSQMGNLYKARSPFGKVCDDIQNPASSINNFMTSYLQSHLIAANTPRNDNLPFLAKFAESMATNLLDNLITGGRPSSQLLSSDGFVAGNIAANNIISGVTETSQLKKVADLSEKELLLTNLKADSIAGQFTISWDASSVPGAAYVTIVGPGLSLTSANAPTAALRLVNNVTVRTIGGISVTVTVYDLARRIITSSVLEIPPVLNPQFKPPTTNPNDLQRIIDAQNTLEPITPDDPDLNTPATTTSLTLNKAMPQVAGVSIQKQSLPAKSQIQIVSRDLIR